MQHQLVAGQCWGRQSAEFLRCVPRCWHRSALVGSFLADRACWLRSWARCWETALWLTVQLRQSVPEKRNRQGKEKSPTPAAVAAVISSFECLQFFFCHLCFWCNFVIRYLQFQPSRFPFWIREYRLHCRTLKLAKHRLWSLRCVRSGGDARQRYS